jgi:hypothetical protein
MSPDAKLYSRAHEQNRPKNVAIPMPSHDKENWNSAKP